MKNKCKWTQNSEFIQHLLSCPPSVVLCLCVSFLNLFFLPNISNLHVPTMEGMNLPCLGPWMKSPLPKKTYDSLPRDSVLKNNNKNQWKQNSFLPKEFIFYLEHPIFQREKKKKHLQNCIRILMALGSKWPVFL